MFLIGVISAAAAGFQDTEGHWAEEAIEKWQTSGVISGYEGAFRPDDKVTRAEFSTMVNNMMKYVEIGENPFSDLNASQWFYEAMLKLYAAGVMNGADGKALPDNNITRQEAAVMVARAFHLKTDSAGTPAFKDAAEIAVWAKDAVAALASKQVIRGMEDGTFRPNDDLTRAQAVAMFDQLIAQLIHKPGAYSADVQGNLVVNTPGVVLKNMSVAGDLYIAQGVGDGEVSLDNVKIKGSVFVYGGGENSVIFNNVDVRGALVVNRYNGKVRILATGNTSVSLTVLESGAILVAKELTGGGFEKILIPENIVKGHEVVLDGNFNTVINRSSLDSIRANGTIRELVAESDTRITGNVVVNNVSASEGIRVTVNDNPVGSGNSPQGPAGGTGGGAGGIGGGGGNTGGSGGGDNGGGTDDGSDGGSDGGTGGGGNDGGTGGGNDGGSGGGDNGGGNDGGTPVLDLKDMKISLSAFTESIVDPASHVDQAVLANSRNISIVGVTQSVYQPNVYEALIVASEAMMSTVQPNGHYLNVVVQLKDKNGNPVQQTADLTVSVTDNVYSRAYGFGELLKSGIQPGSFVFQLDAGEPETIKTYRLTVSHKNKNDGDKVLTLIYIPKGKPYMTGIEAITGETTIGSVIRAGRVKYAGTITEQTPTTYVWVRADQASGPYAVVEGKIGETYEITEADSGKYIRVIAYADQVNAGGFAASEPFGPVEKIQDARDIFRAIESVFLGTNKDLHNITTNLNLVTSLPDYPGVTITWTSDNPAAVTPDGIVSRDAMNDQLVHLTATLQGRIAGEKTKTYELIVRSQGTKNVEIVDFIDPYFAEGYPQAYVKNGNIWVRFKLKKPADVYMVVNTINGQWASDVRAVLQGHAGIGDLIFPTTWPLVKVTDSGQLYDFDTYAMLLRNLPARVEFVVQDKSNNYTSPAVTSIVFDQAVVDAVDTTGPQVQGAFINDARNEIYLYFEEKLDMDSKPLKEHFTLKSGETPVGTIVDTAVHNYDHQYAFYHYVKLTVSGIAEEHLANLTLTYNGDSIRDKSDARNPAQAFEIEVKSPRDQIARALISADRKSATITFDPGFNPLENSLPSVADKGRFAFEVGGQTYAPSEVTYMYSPEFLTYYLTFASPLPEGATKVKINTTGIIGWAKDAYPNELVYENAQVIPSPGNPTAEYSRSEGMLRIRFNEGYQFDKYTTNAAGFTLKVDGGLYKLRGSIVNPSHDQQNVITIYFFDVHTEYFRNVLESGSDISIKYEHAHGNNRHQLSDAAGGLLPEFDFIQVQMKP